MPSSSSKLNENPTETKKTKCENLPTSQILCIGIPIFKHRDKDMKKYLKKINK